MTRRLITPLAVVMLFTAATAYAAVTPNLLGHGSGTCGPPHCFVGTQVVVKHTAIHDDPDGFSIAVSGRLEDAPAACVRRRTVALFFKRRGHRPQAHDVATTHRHSGWALQASERSTPFVVFVRVARKPILRHHGRRGVCANDGLGVFNRRFPPKALEAAGLRE